jgi:hypothetical protein
MLSRGITMWTLRLKFLIPKITIGFMIPLCQSSGIFSRSVIFVNRSCNEFNRVFPPYLRNSFEISSIPQAFPDPRLSRTDLMFSDYWFSVILWNVCRLLQCKWTDNDLGKHINTLYRNRKLKVQEAIKRKEQVFKMKQLNDNSKNKMKGFWNYIKGLDIKWYGSIRSYKILVYLWNKIFNLTLKNVISVLSNWAKMRF